MQFRQQEITITRTTVELEEKRRELVRLERLALAGQISANIFHDLKKPILNIKNEAEELEPSSPEYPIASRIRKQIELFFGILRETSLERFVRAGEDTEYVDINDVLDRSVALVQYEQGNVNIERSYESGLPLVFSQPVRLIQVFSNLILNAYQAMEGRGNLVLRSMLEDGGIVVEVQDNGPGIPAESQARIFQPFYTTKPAGQGTGLGLYIVHEIVKDAGGSVSVKSAPGSTSFRVRLPAATHEA
jgi:signal transduction histidine kinase